MSKKKLQTAYKTILGDNFPDTCTIQFGNQIIVYYKVGWDVPNVEGELEHKGLRYGENPGQEAALYRPVNGNLVVGEVETIQPGRFLASDAELLQSGKHPGKTNITDSDNACNILRYFYSEPCVSIHKHNNPCGVAIGTDILDAYEKADAADKVAAFGGTIGLNRPVDKPTAEAICERYSEVVIAPDFEEGVMEIFAKKKNLRVMRIGNMANLESFVGSRVLDFKSLMDGGFIVQLSYAPEATTLDDIKALPLGYHEHKTGSYEIARKPTEKEYRDMWFGWLVESGITSNSVIFVKNGVTVAIGTGEQDRVGVTDIAMHKAETKAADAFIKSRQDLNIYDFRQVYKQNPHDAEMDAHNQSLIEFMAKGGIGLEGSVMVSDAFFPFPDGPQLAINQGVKAIIQPGGSITDYKTIDLCNANDVTMVYTGQRSFKH